MKSLNLSLDTKTTAQRLAGLPVRAFPAEEKYRSKSLKTKSTWCTHKDARKTVCPEQMKRGG